MTARLRLLAEGRSETPETSSGLLGGQIHYLGGDAEPQTSLVPENVDHHYMRWGHRPAASGAAGTRLLDQLALVGLTGHGGGHFPVAEKWRTQLRAGGGGTVVANAAESEPGSAKDRALLAVRPHLVLDGLVSAAEAVGAGEIIVWTHQSARRTRRHLRVALSERRAAGLAEPPVRLAEGPDHYLTGESSSIVRSLDGGPALPRFRTDRSATRGVGGYPTLVHNVETLARIGSVARHDTRPYRRTTLLTIGRGPVRTVVEVDPTDQLGDVVLAATRLDAGVVPQAMLLGGYGGTWHRWTDIAGLPADGTVAGAVGPDLGAGVVIPVLHDECGLAQVSRITDYLAASSAGQCGPCLFGLRSVADLVRTLARGSGTRRDLPRLHRFLSEIRGRGACHHPDGAIRMIASALAAFPGDVESHLRNGRCRHTEQDPFVTIATAP